MKESTGRPVVIASSTPTHMPLAAGVTNKPRKKSERLPRPKAKVQATKQVKGTAISGFPPQLVGPSPIVPIQVEGIYTKALLDTGAQVTLLYRDFYDRHLKHLPLQKLEELEIWGLGTQNFPYDGYLPVRLTFDPSTAGEAETFDALAIVCPRPPGADKNSLIIGTNTDLVRRLLAPLVLQKGTLPTKIHPMLAQTYRDLRQEEEAPEEGVGKIWLLNRKKKLVQPGEVICLRASVKLSWKKPGPFIVLENTSQEEKKGLELISEVLPTRVLRRTHGKVLVSVRNVAAVPVRVPARLLLGQVSPATPVAACGLTEGPAAEIPAEEFYPKNTPLTPAWRERAKAQLLKWRAAFSKSEFDVGLAKSASHRIRLEEDKPFRERVRRIPLGDLEDLREQLAELKRTGIIRESRSPYASPIVVVRKKNGSLRLCIDYRTLNRRTIPDQYTTPRIEDALQSLAGAKWFSVLDLKSGYYQIPMCPEDKEKTAFITPVGFFEFNRMPQGLSGAPATFQRLMEKTVGDMNLLEVLVYLDDVIVFGRTLEEHEERLEKVLKRLHDEGLKLSMEKCQFYQPSVNYLGHIVSEEGVATDPKKLDAVTSWPRPTNVTELRSFLGFCSYYRRFVEGFAKIAHPLTELLKKQEEVSESPEQSRKPKEGFRRKKESIQDQWTPECEEAFRQLKWSLTTAPVLAYADPAKPYELHVDASREGLGGVLYQEHEGHMRPIAYVSRSLTPAERNYATHKLEFLALKWAVVDKLKDYLYGAEFVVKTDNNPLTYLLTTAKLDATGHRWLAALSAFTFSLKYRPGVGNRDADALSRRPHDPRNPSEDWTQLTPEGVRALWEGTSQYRKSGARAEEVGVSSAGVPRCYCNVSQVVQQGLPKLSRMDLRRDQEEDPLCGLVLEALQHQQSDVLRKSPKKEAQLLLKEWDRLQLHQGVVYRKGPSDGPEAKWQLLLPGKHRERVLIALHDHHGHLGAERTLQLVRDRFYWPHMRKEVESYCHSCLRCIQRKTLPQRAAPMGHLESQGPMDLVCIDFLCLESDLSGQGDILVVTDHFTRYAQAFPTRDQQATTVAKTLVEKFFVHYGLPKRIHSDQGRDFESKLIKRLMDLLGIQKSRTTPYHPQGDPQPERFNRTLLNMLGTLTAEQKPHWSRHITALVHAYNSTKSDATGYSPYRLMFGREARLPVDLAFGSSLDHTSETSHRGYVDRLRRSLKIAYEQAQATSNSRENRNKRNFDLKVRIQDLQPGDRVLLRNLGIPGKHKLADRWRSQPYVVCRKLPGLPVYEIKPEGNTGPVKTWHRNHLLPLTEAVRISTEGESPSTSTDVCRPITRSQLAPSTDEDEEVGLSWLWPPEASETDTDTSSEVDEVNNGTLRAEAPEFVPATHPAKEPSTLIYPPSLVTKGRDDDICKKGIDTPKVQRAKRDIRPPRRLTYDTLGECSEASQFVSKRNLELPGPSTFDSVRDSPISPLGTSVPDTVVSAVSAQDSFPSYDNWWEAPLSVLYDRIEAKIQDRASNLNLFGGPNR